MSPLRFNFLNLFFYPMYFRGKLYRQKVNEVGGERTKEELAFPCKS